MSWKLFRFLSIAVLVCWFSGSVSADTLPVAVFSFDDLGEVIASPDTFGLDLFNYSGPSEATDVFTTLSFEDLSLSVTFTSGPTISAPISAVDAFGDFSTGQAFASGNVLSAVLTGDFVPTVVTLDDGSTVNIASTFSATITDPSGPLQDGDFALVNVVTSPFVAGVPEPNTGVSLLTGLACFAMFALCRR
jgi:hypothetical protein